MQTTTLSKAQRLHELARNYVIKGLGEKNFDAIPYDENVVLRAPLRPGGSENPLSGIENLRQQWWRIEGIRLIDSLPFSQLF